jgi:dTDP-glucose pyrophosphorylase
MSTPQELWSRAILPLDSNVERAAQVLNESSLKIVMVIDGTGILVGTISDGDIRRGLLNGLNLESEISEIINRKPIYVDEIATREEVEVIMLKKRIQQIPIVDSSGLIRGLHLWDGFTSKSELSNKFVIMAGGFGTRLQPLTNLCPKPMIKVGDKPILEHIILNAKRNGFRNFVISVHFLGHLIEEYFGDGQKLGVEIEYLREESPLGTAGALSLLTNVPNEPIVVTNGDVLTSIDYRSILEFHEQQRAAITMAVRPHEMKNPYGVVEIDGLKVVGYTEKPITRTYINAGIYVLAPSTCQNLQKSVRQDMPDLIDTFRRNGSEVLAYPLHESWFDIGRIIDLDSAQTSFSGPMGDTTSD